VLAALKFAQEAAKKIEPRRAAVEEAPIMKMEADTKPQDPQQAGEEPARK
jgi:hypothetical protein